MATVVLACAFAASALLLLAVWCDLATRTIPDGISIALVVLGLTARADAGFGPAAGSVLVAIGLFAAFVPLCASGHLGGGDAKLVAAMAVGLPPTATVDFLVLTVMAGGALALLYVSFRLLPRPAPLAPRPLAWRPRRIAALERRRISRGGPLPYAAAIAAGGIPILIKPFGG